MLQRLIAEAIISNGPTRGSYEQFAKAFSCSIEDARSALTALTRKGVLIEATALPGARSVYSPARNSQADRPGDHALNPKVLVDHEKPFHDRQREN